MMNLDDIDAARRFVMRHSTDYPAVRGGFIKWPKWKLERWRQSWKIIGETVNANYNQFIKLTRKHEAGQRVKLTIVRNDNEAINQEEKNGQVPGIERDIVPSPERVVPTERISESEWGEANWDRH